MMNRAMNLAELLTPETPESFFENYWEKTFLHLSGKPGRFEEMFSLGGIDHALTTRRTGRSDSFVISGWADGGVANQQRFRPEDLNLSNIYGSLGEGASLIVNHLEDYPSLIGTVQSLASTFSGKIGVNAYLTPKNSKTFPIHTDAHDVLILHLEGEKVWHLHDFEILQIEMKQKKNLRFPPEWRGRTETPERGEVRLKPGDVLYIPRGMPHYAVATDSVCLHLTISIVALYWMDVIKVMAEIAAANSQEFRKSLPIGFVQNDETIGEMKSQFERVIEEFREVVSFDDVLTATRRNRVKFQGLPSDGHVEQLTQLDELSSDSVVQRRANLLCTVDEMIDAQARDKVAIFFGHQHVMGPLHLRTAFEFIRQNKKFRVSEIPGLDEKGQLTLARRLIVEGLLQFATQKQGSSNLYPVEASRAG